LLDVDAARVGVEHDVTDTLRSRRKVMLTRRLVRPTAIALAVVGSILLLLALAYMTMKASSLPAFAPGHLAEHVTKKGHTIQTHAHTKLGIVLLLAAVATFAATWWVAFRYEPVD